MKHDFSLKDKNTFGLDVKAAHYVSVQSEEQLREAVRWAKQQEFQVFILGGGSNVLLTRDIPGITISVDISEVKTKELSEDEVLITAGAGMTWHRLVLHAIDQGLGGIENLSLIPGSVGAAPIQNIGAYGVELKEVFHELRAFSIADEAFRTFTPEECAFGYRDSYFKRKGKGKYVITHVTLKLSRSHKVNTSYGTIQEMLDEMGKTTPTIADISEAVISIRQHKLPDPKVTGNAGSFFKNPEVSKAKFGRLHKEFPDMPHYHLDNRKVKIPAAWLIDQCGWKGKRVGNVASHHRQPLVLINKGNATGKEVVALSKMIQQDVKEKFGIELMPEVNII